MTLLKRYEVRVRNSGYAVVLATSKADARRQVDKQAENASLYPQRQDKWSPEVSTIREVGA